MNMSMLSPFPGMPGQSAPEQAKRHAILCSFWPDMSRTDALALAGRTYEDFATFIDQEMTRTGALLTDPSLDLSKLCTIIHHELSRHRSISQARFAKEMHNTLQGDTADILELVYLALRLSTNINISSPGALLGPVQAGLSTVSWLPHESAAQLIERTFPIHAASDGGRGRRNATDLSEVTAVNLVVLCKIRLNWTDNLTDHLKFDPEQEELTVFRHKICLFNYMKYPRMNVLPQRLLEETVDTLNILFPSQDGATKTLLEREGQSFHRLGMCGRASELNLSRYQYWGDRLLDLCRAYERPTRGFRQLASDRRNLNTWVTLWIGVLVLFLTIVSIVFGTVSTVYTIKQYKLALAQACSSTDAAQSLPSYCK